MKTETEKRDLAYYKANAEEDYAQVPISVLKYISELEEVARWEFAIQRGQAVCENCGDNMVDKESDWCQPCLDNPLRVVR